MSDTFSLIEKARGLANLQEQMDNIWIPRQTHKAMIDCLRACADALDAQASPLAEVAIAEDIGALGDDLAYFPELVKHNMHLRAYEIAKRAHPSPLADVAQENEYRDVLSAIAFGLGVGSGDETTTADQFNNRINQGLEMFGNGAKAFGAKLMRERAAGICDQHAKKEAARGRGDFIANQIDRDAIRALPTTFTHAELLAAAMQFPEVKALVDAVKESGDVIESYHKNTGIDLGDASRMPFYKDTMVKIDAALAPFTREVV